MENDIKALWDRGLTMKQIANELGVTRNVVAGKIQRNREMFVARTARERFMRRLAKVPKGIMGLNMNTCRYIRNDDMSEPTYCFMPVERGAYCGRHAALCYVPRGSKKND